MHEWSLIISKIFVLLPTYILKILPMKKFCALLALLCVAAVAFAGPDFYLRGHDGVWFEVRDEYKFKQEGDV